MKSTFILTGAGISAESGIPTFRGSTGLWEGHRVEDVARPAGFAAEAARLGIHTTEVNPNTTEISPHFDEHLRGPAANLVPDLVEKWLAPA